MASKAPIGSQSGNGSHHGSQHGSDAYENDFFEIDNSVAALGSTRVYRSLWRDPQN